MSTEKQGGSRRNVDGAAPSCRADTSLGDVALPLHCFGRGEASVGRTGLSGDGHREDVNEDVRSRRGDRCQVLVEDVMVQWTEN